MRATTSNFRFPTPKATAGNFLDVGSWKLGVVCAALCAACAGSGHIAGRVTQVEDRTPLGNVSLTLDGRRTHAATTTDASGRFDFGGLPPGPYVLKAETQEFASETRDTLSVMRGATTTADFALHPACLEEGSY